MTYPKTSPLTSPMATGVSRRGSWRKPAARLAALCVLTAAGAAAMAAEYTVVVLQSLTGPAAFVGVSARDGMLLAAEEINRKQEMGPGNTLKLIVADDANDKAQTLTLLNRYAADPSILIVVGPTSSATALAAASASNDLKIPIFPITNSMDIIKAGPWANIMTQPPEAVVPHIANYAADKLKVKNCTSIGISDVQVYVSLSRGFENVLKARGVKVGAVESIKGSDSDFSALATKVVGGDQDCVFISATAPQGANIIMQLKQAGLDPKTKILGHAAFGSSQLVQTGGKAVEGVYLVGDWAPGGSSDFGRAFAAAFKAKYNADADNYNAVGYGGMRVVAAAIKAAGPNPTRETVRAALSRSKDVPVVVGNGRFTYDEQRIPQTGMNVLMVREGKFELAP